MSRRPKFDPKVVEAVELAEAELEVPGDEQDATPIGSGIELAIDPLRDAVDLWVEEQERCWPINNVYTKAR